MLALALVATLGFLILSSRWAIPVLLFLLIGPNPGRGVQNALGPAWG